MIADMSDGDLLARLKNFEDQFVERKTVADSKDWLKTVVAFANSAPIGFPCILYIGVRDNGDFESKVSDLDSVQKTLNRMLQNIQPRTAYLPKIIREGGMQALAVIVPGSNLRPHFSGPSYVRKGSETMEASEEQLTRLINSRTSKVYEILRYLGKPISVENCSVLGNGQIQRGRWSWDTVVVDCNSFWVTLQASQIGTKSYILRDIELNYDHDRNRLKLEITTRDF